MSEHETGDFVRYVEDRRIHDAAVLRVDMLEKRVDVALKGADDQTFTVSFIGLHSLTSNRPEGMVLYALAELKPEGSFRRFSFVNWDENDAAFLEVIATEYRIEG